MNKNSFKKCMVCFLLIGSICSVIACGSNPKIHGAAESVDNWEAALQYLKDGNKRFVNNNGITRNTNKTDRDILKDGQKPFAVIVTCADSQLSTDSAAP